MYLRKTKSVEVFTPMTEVQMICFVKLLYIFFKVKGASLESFYCRPVDSFNSLRCIENLSVRPLETGRSFGEVSER